MPFDLQPTLTGALVELRPLAADDFAARNAVAADPLIWEQHPIRDRCEEEVFRGFLAEQLASAVEKVGGVLVGSRLDGRGRQSVAYQIDAATFHELV